MKLSQALVKRLGLGMAAIWIIAGCGKNPTDQSQIKVTNGIEIPNEEYPAVVLLYDNKKGSICTGTFVTETVVLTAAHCTQSGEADENGNVDFSLSLIEIIDLAEKKAKKIADSVKIVRNPEWERNGRNVNRYDLSLVYFEEGVATAVRQIASEPARQGDEFTIVGFGLNSMGNLNDNSSAGVKRKGVNQISRISGGFLHFTGKSGTTDASGTDVSASRGDSGGPLFVKGHVAGVTSGGGWGGFGRTRSLYIDLHSSTSKEFLQKYIRY